MTGGWICFREPVGSRWQRRQRDLREKSAPASEQDFPPEERRHFREPVRSVFRKYAGQHYGASYGDINNDGCYDFYLGSGGPESWFVMPHLLYLGESSGTNCTGRMENISMLFGAGNVQKGHGIVFFDFNNDGLQDIYSSLGGMWPGDAWNNQLFVNKSTTRTPGSKSACAGARQPFWRGCCDSGDSRQCESERIVRTYDMDARTGFGSARILPTSA